MLTANQSRRLTAVIVSLTYNVENLVKIINELDRNDRLLLVDVILSINHLLQKIKTITRIDSAEFLKLTRFAPKVIRNDNNGEGD